jgi:hypothetical protein
VRRNRKRPTGDQNDDDVIYSEETMKLTDLSAAQHNAGVGKKDRVVDDDAMSRFGVRVREGEYLSSD